VCGAGDPNLLVLEGLASFHLAARRRGARVVLDDVCAELVVLLELTGLAGEMLGQPEARKDVLGVEEAVEADNPPG
jgi:hypothetical protein